jgi:hypothetical protein
MSESLERPPVGNAYIERIHKQAEAVLEQDRILEQDFIEPYGKDTVARDLAWVAKREEEHARQSTPESIEAKQVADIFEALILWNGEQSNWLGESAITKKTSKFDDYENGVDAIIEFQTENPRTASHLGLAADVTFSSDTTRKFDRLRKLIEKGELARVKYFHFEHMNMHGQLSKLPEVIIGAERRTVMELAELWDQKKFKSLADHKVQIMMLLQMREQLLTFSMYAESLGKTHLADIYRERLQIIQDILDKKKDIALRVKYEIDDKVHASIMNFMARWQKDMEGKQRAA